MAHKDALAEGVESSHQRNKQIESTARNLIAIIRESKKKAILNEGDSSRNLQLVLLVFHKKEEKL